MMARPPAEDFYASIPGDYYVGSARSFNPISAWYHASRFKAISEIVSRLYREGDEIVDLGCGGSLWNERKLPVVGVDLNPAALAYGAENGFLCETKMANIENGLPPSWAGRFAIAVLSEVIEHVASPGPLLSETHRILKPGGRLLITAPFDTPTSAWRYLFGLQCFLQGTVFGNEYYRHRCGHVQQFSRESLSALSSANGFILESFRVRARMNIVAVCVKR